MRDRPANRIARRVRSYRWMTLIVACGHRPAPALPRDSRRVRREDHRSCPDVPAMLLSRLTSLIAFALLTACSLAHAQSLRSGDIIVHYNAISTTQLGEEIARRYAIERAPDRALLTVSVQQAQPGNLARALTAKIVVVVTNARRERLPLQLREVRENDSISYIGEARIEGDEALDFDLQVTPQGSEKPIVARFRQEFFQ